jgi:hypothetical protein
MFKIKIEINILSLNLPRVNDRWLMKVLEAEGYREVELITLNRVRCYQQVIFILDKKMIPLYPQVCVNT